MKSRKITRRALKAIAIIAMAADHLACVLLSSEAVLYQITRFFGRFAFPIMAYFLSEGYRYTRNRRHYAVRLFLFAVISQLPYALAFRTSIIPFNAVATLLLGLAVIAVADSNDFAKSAKSIIIAGLIAVGAVSDHSWLGPLLPFLFWRYHGKKRWIAYYCAVSLFIAFCLVTSEKSIGWYVFGYLIPPLIISQHSKERETDGVLSKWFFYVFYPMHLFLIVICNYSR